MKWNRVREREGGEGERVRECVREGERVRETERTWDYKR